MGERHICFSSDRLKVVSKLIEGPYPKYQNVIPNQFEKEVVLQRQEALSVLRRVATMANQKNRQIKLEFQDDKLEVSAENQEIGSSCKEPLAAQYAGEAGFKIAFNANFLIDILKMCPSDQVKIKMNSPLGACVIHPVGEGMDFYFLLMPLRFYED
jgi:DNA polymerase-3 subunit beta